jgi:two-component system response regulator AlgR
MANLDKLDPAQTARSGSLPPLRLLLVDDEALARARLRSLVEALGEGQDAVAAEVVAEAATASAALAALQAAAGEGGIDAVLLDIGLPGTNGLAFATTLRALARPPAVVFVTAHAAHALQAFELQALDYLTKPVRRDRLQQALARVRRWRMGEAAPRPGGMPAEGAAIAPVPVLVLHERGRVLRLPHDEILWLRAGQKTVHVHTASRDFTVDESLNDLEQRLGEGFLRVHRNALVARHAIRALELRPGLDEEAGGDGWAVQVGGTAGAGGEWLAVSRRQVASVKAALAREAGER